MGSRHWTTKEIQYIKKAALLDSTNSVVNIDKLAKHLKRSNKAVAKRISIMRKDGALPKIQRENAIDTTGQPYSKHAIKRIEAMVKNGSTAKEIANSLGRTESSIYSTIARLRKKGIIKTQPKRVWDPEEEEYLLNHIQFDEHGFTENTQELANVLNRPFNSVTYKISQLRRNGSITVKADKSKTSVKAKRAHDQFNQRRFAEHVKEVQPVVNTPNKVEVVQVVHVITEGPKGEELHQFWTFDGQLLAENKKRPLCKVT